MVEELKVDQARRAHDCDMVLYGHDGVFRPKDQKYVLRSEFITKMQQNLARKSDKGGIIKFMNSMTCKQNKVQYNMAQFNLVNGGEEEDDPVFHLLSFVNQ